MGEHLVCHTMSSVVSNQGGGECTRGISRYSDLQQLLASSKENKTVNSPFSTETFNSSNTFCQLLLVLVFASWILMTLILCSYLAAPFWMTGVESFWILKFKSCPKWRIFFPEQTIFVVTEDGINCLFTGIAEFFACLIYFF